MIHAQADLKQALSASVFVTECEAAIARAMNSRRERDLKIAADMINSRQHDALPDEVQIILAKQYAVAAVACYGGLA